jgi:ATP-binding cassette subfamily G (WHITE) protein 1
LNHWYSLKAYYLAKTLADIPFQIIFPTVYLVIVYLMTNQPMELDRFAMLLTITICMSLVGQGIGLFFGAAFNIKLAVFLALSCLIPFMMFSGFNATFDSIPYYLKWLSYVSLFRHSFEGSMLSIYGFGRPFLDCSQFYCQFRNPQRFLEEFNMDQNSYYWSVVGLLTFFLVVRVVGYFVLRFKLKNML